MATPDAAEAGLADSPPEVAEHGPSTLSTVLPLLVSPALSKFAAGVEAVIKSQSSLAAELERLNAETLRLDTAPLIPAQIEAAEKLKRCRKMIESVSKFTKNIKTRIGTINGYKASILQHIPELKTVGSSGAAASSSAIAVAPVVSSGAVDAADAAADACEADAAPTASAAVQQVSSPSLDSATPVMAAGAVGPSAEKSTFSVVLKAKGASPYQVIKEVRAITGLGLKEAQALVDGLPHVVKEGASWEEAKAIEAQLTAAGGDVQVE